MTGVAGVGGVGGVMRGQSQGRGSHGQLLRPPLPPHAPVRPSDSELALQKLASLDVSNKGLLCPHLTGLFRTWTCTGLLMKHVLFSMK